jgi:multidrug efflux pump subunit AcrB
MSRSTKKRLTRQLVVATIFVLAFVLFWLFLRYLTTDRVPQQDTGAVNSGWTASPLNFRLPGGHIA